MKKEAKNFFLFSRRLVPLPTLPSDLSPGGSHAYRGYIDTLDVARGVRGWAVNLAAPRTPPALALRVGSTTVARTTPNRPRDDITAAVTPGFAFDAETLHRAASLAATPYDLITVCIEGTDLELDSALPPVRIGDLNISPAPSPTTQGDPEPRGQAHGAQAVIDRLLVIPGLGCMVDGWIVSPQKPVAGFRLRMSGAIFTPRADAMYRKPRRDLLAAFPHAEQLVANAGFVALLTGEGDLRHAANPILQLIFADGGTYSLDLPPTLPRLLGHTATAADALYFFPSLAAEPFFAQFGTAVVAAERAAIAAPVPIALVQTPRTLVLVLPENSNDLFLAFESIAGACRENLIDGLTLIAATDSNRANAPWHLRDLLASHQVPTSLVSVADARTAFSLLPEILRLTGAKRFCYVAANQFLTLPAYRLVAAYLRGTAKPPMFLGAFADPFAQAEAPFPTSRCFAWSTPPFMRWVETAPAFLGGHYRDNMLPQAAGAAKLHPDMVRSSVPLTAMAIEQAVNCALYAAALV